MDADRALDARIQITVGPDFRLDVALSAPPGVTILFGPSGSGKSTTLAAIAGLIRPDGGRIALGRDVWFDAGAGVDRPVHRRDVAFVFQSLALFPHMTALENVAYGVDPALPGAERRRRALSTLERMKVPHLASRRPATFSGGEAQRVALARAFARAPKLALLDEPFSALDRGLWMDLCADVRSTIADLGIPCVMVTHRRNEARAMGDRLAFIAGGRIRKAGSMQELAADLEAPDETD